MPRPNKQILTDIAEQCSHNTEGILFTVVSRLMEKGLIDADDLELMITDGQSLINQGFNKYDKLPRFPR